MENKAIPFSRARRAILSLLFGQSEESFYFRQIVRASGYGLGPVQRELKLLTEAGIILRTVRGRQVYFQANSESPIFQELKGLITKTVGIGDTLRDALAPIGKELSVVFIYGSIARGEETRRSDIDLLIVGNVSFSDIVVRLQAAQKTLGREINPTVYSGAEFRMRLRKHHHFLTSLVNGPKIYLIGDENELGRLAPKRLARIAQVKSAGNR